MNNSEKAVRYRYKNRYILTHSPKGISYRFRNVDVWNVADESPSGDQYKYNEHILKSRKMLELARERVKEKSYELMKAEIHKYGKSCIFVSENSPSVTKEFLDNFWNELDEWHKIEEMEKDKNKMYD